MRQITLHSLEINIVRNTYYYDLERVGSAVENNFLKKFKLSSTLVLTSVMLASASNVSANETDAFYYFCVASTEGVSPQRRYISAPIAAKTTSLAETNSFIEGFKNYLQSSHSVTKASANCRWSRGLDKALKSISDEIGRYKGTRLGFGDNVVKGDYIETEWNGL